jgi:hypothetical protein
MKKIRKILFIYVVIFTNGLFSQGSIKTIKIENLDVASTDLVIPELQAKGLDPIYKYDDHIEYFLEDHPEWRLPTLDELIFLYKFRDKLGMQGSFYMAFGTSPNSKYGSKYSNHVCWVNYFSLAEYDINVNERCSVRLIKK